MPLTPGHLDFCWQAKETLHREGIKVAVLLVQYTLSPQAVYPEQLKQCVEAVRYVVEDRRRSPSNLLLAGDSAGAALVLGVLAHIIHPHRSITRLIIKERFRGLLLISPWGDFKTNSGSWRRNIDKDMCASQTLESWSEAYLGGKTSDSYTEPCNADSDWWRGLQARRVMVTAGAEEVLVDSVNRSGKESKGRSISLVKRTASGWGMLTHCPGLSPGHHTSCWLRRMPCSSYIVLQLRRRRQRPTSRGDRQLAGLIFSKRGDYTDYAESTVAGVDTGNFQLIRQTKEASTYVLDLSGKDAVLLQNFVPKDFFFRSFLHTLIYYDAISVSYFLG